MRLYWRFSAVILVLASLLAIAAAPAAADERKAKDYLALGDSVAFGFSPLLDPRNAANFVGYPDVVARDEELRLTNASCPGEATGGFISLTSPDDNGCRRYRFTFGLPLHVNYSSSQLDFTLSFLASHPRTRLVTIDIGANDLFVFQRQCGTDAACLETKLASTIPANLNTIFGQIRNNAHYHHQLVSLTYYALNYNDPNAVAVVTFLNTLIANATVAAGGQVASGFDAFKPVAVAAGGGDSCAAGLLIRTSPTTCDIHPSPQGRDLLAAAIERVLVDEADGAQVR
jgi:lysophospholipase L1-like esterase